MRCRFFSHRLRSGWHALTSLVRGPSAAAGMIAASVGGALLLMPAETVCLDLNFAGAFASVSILDWVGRSLGLILLLLRRLGATEGG